MTVMAERVGQATGPAVVDPTDSSQAYFAVGADAAEQSDSIARVPDEVMQRAERLSRQWGKHTEARVALLGVLMARLQHVPFEDRALLLKVRPQRLEKLIHGEEQVPPDRESDWETIANMLRELEAVLRPEATGLWLHTEIPALGARTPLQSIARGELRRVAAVVHSYLDPSFS